MENLIPGCVLWVKKGSEIVPEDKAVLQRLHIERGNNIYVTFIDSSGVSIYVKRSGLPDIHAFVPKNTGFTNWMSFFEINPSVTPVWAYKGSKHAKILFPKECV